MSSKSSKTDPDSSDSRVLVARVRRPHGLAGEMLVETISTVAGRFDPGSRLELSAPAGARRQVEVLASRIHAGGMLLQLSGISDRDAAAAWRGGVLEVSRSAVPPPAEGDYYFFDLENCRCSDETEGDLGEVVKVIEDGGGLLLEVSDGKRRLLLPFVKAYLVAVDLEAQEIRFNLPEGLIETCASPY